MFCPKCKKNLDLTSQVKDWEDNYGDDAMLSADFPIYIGLTCGHCDTIVGAIFIEKVTRTRAVDSPFLGEVEVPEFKEGVNIEEIGKYSKRGKSAKKTSVKQKK